MMEYKKLNDVYSNWVTSGIFSDLQNYGVPWKDKDINHDLDISYHGNHSGDKIVSVIIDKLLSDDGTLSQVNRNNIASAIFAMYGDNWRHLWDTTIQEYNLLDNTDAYITETTTSEENTDTNNSGTNTGTVTHDISGDDTTTNTGTITTEGASNENTTNNNSIYGFNSSGASNSDSQSSNGQTSANQTETRNTTDKLTHNTKDAETRNLSNSNIGKQKTTGNITHETHRHGNIGVTTNQQMLSAERDLWKWYFYKYVFTDLDRFLTINIY